MHVTETAADIESVREFLDREQVHTVECAFADTWGIPRGKRLSTQHFCSVAAGTGFAIANVALTTFTNYLNETVHTDIDFPVVHHRPR